MKWFIIVLLTANPNVSADVITNPKFDTKELCREYVVKNYDELNKRVNEDYSQHQSTPNLFHCVNHKSKR
tara:strand:+ start:40 stop:249 length:210 start_codon:yes stop_codon:yes gene_type:complete